jgi:hypothetical protein
MDFNSLFWIFSSIGMTHIITGTSIFEKIRAKVFYYSPDFFGVLVGCPTCMGFWVGVFLSLFFPIVQIYDLSSEIITNSTVKLFALFFLHGCFSSAINWITHLFVTYLDVKTTHVEIKSQLIIENPLEIAKQILTENQK